MTSLGTKKGFTLIELILYISLISIVVGAMVTFSWEMVQASVKSSGQEELAANARMISNRINTEIRNSLGINSISANSISLIGVSPNNPTVIDLNSGRVRISLGASAPVNISSAGVTVNNLAFTNLSSGDTSTQNISFSLSLSLNNSSPRPEYQQSLTLQSCAEIRSN